MQHLQWEMLGRVRAQALLRGRSHPLSSRGTSSGSPLGQILIHVGRRIERFGHRLGGRPVADVAAAGGSR